MSTLIETVNYVVNYDEYFANEIAKLAVAKKIYIDFIGQMSYRDIIFICKKIYHIDSYEKMNDLYMILKKSPRHLDDFMHHCIKYFGYC